MARKRRAKIALAGGLGLQDAKDTCAKLVQALEKFDTVEVDLSELTSVDVSIVQLLIAARKSASARGKALTISSNSSENFRGTLAEIGLSGTQGGGCNLDAAFWFGGKGLEGQTL
ncbi:protein of unknown function [Candidatus Filomicrobium marinum]|uniref:STAS domain-containing protein n=2 Tax=Filomicrobium TaxID=119044 RepID=A0A0D6JJ04_9HYPH|nr:MULTISPECIES: STAS domain-containing protein [Filomicrobium]MCV0370908.1 STAS domain-containing protein [Filomicrobium sp.]CFX33164.1 protein of unknown function [Candidatus Filomicrobium marinum]CPR21933.1 protein of unknown function [Candidatus Filomicrobium marinum]SDP48399.1 STAS domain-containing protein [Filomicrobium insigne]